MDLFGARDTETAQPTVVMSGTNGATAVKNVRQKVNLAALKVRYGVNGLKNALLKRNAALTTTKSTRSIANCIKRAKMNVNAVLQMNLIVFEWKITLIQLTT